MARPGPDAGAQHNGGHERLRRLWWAAPGAVVAGSAIGVAVVVGPTLGQQVGVPRELVVPATATTPTTVPSPPRTGVQRHPLPRPTATSTASPSPVIRVVQPRRPLVTASPSGGHDRHDDSGTREGGDG